MGAMKNILLALVSIVVITGCSAPNMKAQPPNKIRARITYYNAHEDKWGARLASGNGRAKEGVTVAAHPIFNFGTQITIPGLRGYVGAGLFTVQDRGSAVTRKKASHGNEFVFDVFLNKTRKATAAFANKMPAYMDVIVSKPIEWFSKDKVVHRKLTKKKRK